MTTTKLVGDVLLKTETVNPASKREQEFEYIDVSSVSNETFTVVDTQHLLGKDAPSRARKLVRTDDILFATIRPTLQRIALVPEHLDAQVCSTGYFVLRAGKQVLSKYLFHYLFTREFTAQMESLQKGASYPAVNDSDVRSQLIAYPSLKEQKRIVTLLDEAFAHIATAKANAEQNLQNARALFAAGFSSFATATEQDQWSRTTVEAIAAPKKNAIRTGPFGSQLLHGEFVDAGIAVLGIDNAVSNEFRWGKSRFISVEKYKQLERYKVYPGDVLITIMGTCGRCAVVPDDIPIAINTKHLCCITTDWKKCLPSYLHAYFLYHPIAQDFLIKHAKGSIMAGLNMGLIQDLPLLLPAIDRQQEIVERLNLLQKETQRLESIYQQKLSALDALKKSLLHQAFSGQL